MARRKTAKSPLLLVAWVLAAGPAGTHAQAKPHYYATSFAGTYKETCVAGCAAMNMVPACVDVDDVGPAFAARLMDHTGKRLATKDQKRWKFWTGAHHTYLTTTQKQLAPTWYRSDGWVAPREWFLGVHFAKNWVSVPEGFLVGK